MGPPSSQSHQCRVAGTKWPILSSCRASGGARIAGPELPVSAVATTSTSSHVLVFGCLGGAGSTWTIETRGRKPWPS